MLCLIDGMDVPDKHRTLTPVGDYTKISSEIIRRQVPDFPGGISGSSFGGNYRDIGWRNTSVIRPVTPPMSEIVETKIDIPVDVVFVITKPDFCGPVIPTLHKLVDTARETIAIIRDATR